MTDQTSSSTLSLASNSVIPFPGAAGMGRNAAIHDINYEWTDGIPTAFSLNSDGIYQLRSGDDEDLMPVLVCSPLIVRGICRTSNGEGWGSIISVKDPDGVWHELILDARDIQRKSTATLNMLFDNGLELSPVDKAAQSVLELLASWRPQARILRAARLGWTDKTFTSFALGNGRVLGEANVVVDAISGDVAAAMHERGTIEGWRGEIAKPSQGNPLMILSLSHAFSGPLLSLLGHTGGGFHLRGLSSRGKSTLQYAATSVWGAPSFMQGWRATDNGIEGVAAACNDSLLVLEELHEVQPRLAGDIVYMLANGRGKSRRSSRSTAQDTLRWTVPILSSGEISLEEHMASGNRKMQAGQDVRLIDLVADTRSYGAFDELHGEHDGKAFAERLKNASESHYGVAGPKFVQHLMCHIDKREAFLCYINKFCRMCEEKADLPLDGQVQRVLTRFGIAALAGTLATKFGLTGWNSGAASAAAQELFIEWFEARDGSTKSEIKNVVHRIQDYLSKDSAGFADLAVQSSPPRDGWKDKDWFYILPSCWEAIHATNDPTEAARMLHSAGLLKVQKGGGHQFKMGRNGAMLEFG